MKYLVTQIVTRSQVVGGFSAADALGAFKKADTSKDSKDTRFTVDEYREKEREEDEK